MKYLIAGLAVISVLVAMSSHRSAPPPLRALSPRSPAKFIPKSSPIARIEKAATIEKPTAAQMPEVTLDVDTQSKSEIEREDAYLEQLEQMTFPQGREIGRTQLKNGRERIQYQLESGEKFSRVINPDGTIASESLKTANGENLNRMYYANGQLHEVNFYSRQGGFYVTYDQDGNEKDRQHVIGGKSYPGRNVSQPKLLSRAGNVSSTHIER
jgi:hypothetical protein